MNSHHAEDDELQEPVWIEVRAVLMEHWDPIGVCGKLNATNEYDSYVPKIKALLRASTSIDSVMDYLDWVASERMGFTSQRERGREAAELLMPLASHLSHDDSPSAA